GRESIRLGSPSVSALPDQILLALAAVGGCRDVVANEEGDQGARFNGPFSDALGIDLDRSLQPGRVQIAALHHAGVSGIHHSFRSPPPLLHYRSSEDA